MHAPETHKETLLMGILDLFFDSERYDKERQAILDRQHSMDMIVSHKSTLISSIGSKLHDINSLAVIIDNLAGVHSHMIKLGYTSYKLDKDYSVVIDCSGVLTLRYKYGE